MNITLPSKSNTYGSLAGLVAGFATAKLTSVGVVAAVASFSGLPAASVVILLGAVVASLVNYGVTHVSELKNLDDVIAALPKTYPQYPNDPRGPTNTNNLQNPQG